MNLRHYCTDLESYTSSNFDNKVLLVTMQEVEDKNAELYNLVHYRYNFSTKYY